MTKVFIDGSAGTTGLRLLSRLSDRSDISLTVLTGDERKSPEARKKALNSCDVAFLCLPDAAATEDVAMIENTDVKIIDTSTAHRTSEGWAYGFPELSAAHRKKIEKSHRIASPGCHAGGYIALVAPLVERGILPKDIRLTCFSLTGYSGGGKSMIADYESEGRDSLLGAPRQYGITQQHKHLKEMTKITGIDTPPVFCPIVGDFYSGMEMTVPLFSDDISDGYSVSDIKDTYRELYSAGLVKYVENTAENGFYSALHLSGKDTMEISVEGNEDRILLIARYDNLGKGASGAAIECFNIISGLPDEYGLEI